MTIMTISSYNMRPHFSMYWSVDEDIGLPLVRSLMSRNKFRKRRLIYIAVIIQNWMKETNGLS